MGRLQDITERLGDVSQEEWEVFHQVDTMLTERNPMVAIPFTYLKTLVQYADKLFRVYEDAKDGAALTDEDPQKVQEMLDVVLTKEEVKEVEEAVIMGIAIFGELGGEILEMLEQQKQEGLQGPLAQKSPFMGGNGQKH